MASLATQQVAQAIATNVRPALRVAFYNVQREKL